MDASVKNVVLYSHQLSFVYNKDVEMSAGSNKHELVSAMKGHVIRFGEAIAIYSQ